MRHRRFYLLIVPAIFAILIALVFSPLYNAKSMEFVITRILRRGGIEATVSIESPAARVGSELTIQRGEIVFTDHAQLERIVIDDLSITYSFAEAFSSPPVALLRDVDAEQIEISLATDTQRQASEPTARGPLIESLRANETRVIRQITTARRSGVRAHIPVRLRRGEAVLGNALVRLDETGGTISTTSGAYGATLRIGEETIDVGGAGPGISVSGTIDRERGELQLDLIPPELAIPEESAIGRVLNAPKIAEVAEVVRIDLAVTGGATEDGPVTSLVTRIGSVRDTVVDSMSGEVESSIDTESSAPLPEISFSASTRGVDLAVLRMTVPAVDDLVGISFLRPEAVVTEATIAGEIREGVLHASVDFQTPPLLSVAAEGITVPLKQPRRFSIDRATVSIPRDAPVLLTDLPPETRDALRRGGILTDGSGDIGTTAVSTEVTVTTENAGQPIFTVTVDGAPDRVLAARIAVGLDTREVRILTANTDWRIGDTRIVAREVGGSAPWSDIQLFAVGEIPSSIEATGNLAFRSSTATVEFAWRIASGVAVLSPVTGTFADREFSVTPGARDGGTPKDGAVRITPTGDGYRVAPATIAIADGTIDLAAFIGRDGISVDATARTLSIPTLIGSSDPIVTAGRLSGTIAVDTRLERPNIDASLTAERIELFGETGTIRIEVNQDSRGVNLDNLTFDIAPIVSGSISGRLPIAIERSGVTPLNLMDATVRGTVRSDEFERFFDRDERELLPRGTLTADIMLAERSGDLRSSFEFRVRPDESTVGETVFGFGYQRLTGTLSLTERSSDQLNAKITLAADREEIGTATMSLSVPGLSAARPTRRPETISGVLDAEIDIPLEYAAPFVPNVVALTGSLTGRIDGTGTLASPRLSGVIAVTDGELRTSGAIAPISAIDGSIRFNGRRFFSEGFSAESGLAPFSIAIEGQLPSEDAHGELLVHLRGENVLLTTSPILRVRGTTDLKLSGSSAEGFLLAGTVTVEDALYSQDIPLVDFDTVPSVDPEMFQLFSVRRRFAADTELDIRIDADNTIRVENNLYTGAFSADMNLGGTLEVPRPRGRVFAGGGTLQLPLTSLRMQSVVLRFPFDRPFSPELQARGNARLQDYSVSVVVRGALPGVEIDISSTPALSQGDALVLLTTGFTPGELARSGNRAALAIGSRLGTQFVQSLIGSSAGPTGADLADRVSVILGEGVSESGSQTIEIEFRLTEEDSWFLVFRRDRYERYNMDLAWRFWLE